MELSIDPCGVIVDWIGPIKKRPFWFFPPDPVRPVPALPVQAARSAFGLSQPDIPQLRKWVMIRWYKAPAGAKVLPFPTIYGSSTWLNEIENCATEFGEIPFYTKGTGAGDLIGIPSPAHSTAGPPLGVSGQRPCGTPEEWNSPLSGPGLKRGPGGAPICCNPGLGAAVGFSRPNRLFPAAGSICFKGGFNVQAALAFHGLPCAAANLGAGYLPADGGGIGLLAEDSRDRAAELGLQIGLGFTFPPDAGEVGLQLGLGVDYLGTAGEIGLQVGLWLVDFADVGLQLGLSVQLQPDAGEVGLQLGLGVTFPADAGEIGVKVGLWLVDLGELGLQIGLGVTFPPDEGEVGLQIGLGVVLPPDAGEVGLQIGLD